VVPINIILFVVSNVRIPDNIKLRDTLLISKLFSVCQNPGLLSEAFLASVCQTAKSPIDLRIGGGLAIYVDGGVDGFEDSKSVHHIMLKVSSIILLIFLPKIVFLAKQSLKAL